MSKFFAAIFNHLSTLLPRVTRRGSTIVEYAIILGLVSIVSIGAILALSQKTDTSLCQSANGLGGGTGKYYEHCEGKGFGESAKKGFGKDGFVDLYLNMAELETRRVILPVKIFDVKGLDEILTSTDRLDSVAACYELDNNQVTCASMRGLNSAFTFPPGVTGVGYEIRPLPDDRDAMAQPVSITLGSVDNPQNNKTWNIHVYREGVPNIFAPEIAFADLKLPAGTIGEYNVMEELRGEFDRDDLEFTITPTEGEFAICSQDKPASESTCGLSQAEMSWLSAPTDTHALGYQLHLPNDVRTPVAWPLTVKLASPYDPEVDQLTWDIVVSRISTEAPAFHTFDFQDVIFESDATGIQYTMVNLDQDYPSDLMLRAPQGEEGLAFCYMDTADGDPNCSPDVGVQDVALTVPAGAYSVGYATNLPEDVLNAFNRQIEFSIASVDYPDFVEEVSVSNTRPEFVPVFEPTVVFADKAFPEGAVGDQVELVDLTGTFNSDLVLVISAPQPGSKVCVLMPDAPDGSAGDQICSGAADELEMQLDVPMTSPRIGYSVDLGESAFQPVDKSIQFELRDSKDPSLKAAYSVRITRPAADVVFEPNMAAMTIDPVTYDEMATGWQAPQMTPVAGTFNTDLLLTTPSGADYVDPCYKMTAGSDPVCGDTPSGDGAAPGGGAAPMGAAPMQAAPGKSLRVPNGAYAIGMRPFLSEDIHIEQDLQLSMTLGSAETSQFAEAMSSSAYRPAVPVKFDPNLGFRDKVFDAGLSGVQYAMVPIEGEITTGLTMNAPQTTYALRMCYIDVAGSMPICSTDAQFGDAIIEVPQNSLSVGYRVELPNDIHVDWAQNVVFKVTSSYDETLDYDVNVNVSRESNTAAYTPSTEFGEITFEPGTTGSQMVIKPIAGNVNTQGQVVMPASGYAVYPCFQKTETAKAVCTNEAAMDADQIAHPDWPGVQPGVIKPRMYAAGYKVDLPDDVHTAVDWTFTFRLESTYDDALGRDYTVRVVRDALPVTWEPDASMKLPDADFAVKSTGAQDTIIPFKGNFTTKTDYVISGTKQPVHPCHRQSSTGDIVCGDSAAGVGAQITLDPDWEFIGYRVILPSDLAEEVEETVNVTLSSAYDSSLYVGQTFKIYREPAPVVFSPTVSFSDHTFTKAETGWQRVMEPLTGNMTTDLELHAPASESILLCAQDVAGGDTRCTSEGSANAEKTLDVAPNAHAIGYAVKLPDDPMVNNTQTISFDLRMKAYPSQRRSFTVTTNRPKPDVTFSTNMNFANANFPEGMTGWFNFMQPLNGSFSSDIELVAGNPSSDMKLCSQAVSGGEVSCQASDKKMPIDKSSYAIGYALEFGDDVFVAWQRTANLTLRSKPYPSVKKDWAPTIKRAARNVVLPPQNLFASSQVYEPGESGERMIMAALNGVGNSDMVFEIGTTSFDARLCIQETETSAISCQSSSAQAGGQSYDITPETFKIGYRISLPTNKFDKYEHQLRFAIKSKAVESQVRNYLITLRRPVQTPVMPAQDLFGDVSYPAKTTGEKTIMAQLDPKIDTQLSMTKNVNQSDIGVCYQQSPTGAVTCEGLNSPQSATIIDENRSWYAAGYRVKLPDSDWEDVNKTVNFEIASEDVPGERNLYRPRLVRPALETIMPGAGFFPDQQYAAGTTGPKLFMAALDPATNTQLTLSKSSNQSDLELCYKTTASGPATCVGEGINSFQVTDADKNWHSIGYRIYLDDDDEKEIVRTLSLKIMSADVPEDIENYSVEITRMRMNATMPDRTFFEDQIVSEGTEGDVKFMEILGDATNISLKLHKAAGQPEVAICYQQTASSTVVCVGKGDTGEVGQIIDLGWRSMGYQVDVGNRFDNVNRQVRLHLTARDGVSNRVDYDLNISKTGTDMVMPAANMFGDEAYAQGEFGDKTVMAPFKPGINTSLKMVKEAGQPNLALCRKRYSSSSISCYGAGDTSAYELVVDPTDFQVGYRINVGKSEFVGHDEFQNFGFVSTEAENERVDYRVHTTKPATPIDMPPADFFQDVTFAEGETGAKQILPLINGSINAAVDLRVPTGQQMVTLCYKANETHTPYCNGHNASSDASRVIQPTWYAMGFSITLDNDVFKEIDETLTFSIVSQEDESVRQNYSIRIYRPGKPVMMPPANFFQDVTFAEGETGMQHIMKEISGVINAPVDMSLPTNQYFGYICYTGSSGNDPYCPTHNYSNDAERTIAHYWYEFGYAVNLDKDVFKEIDETITFSLVSQADPSKRQDYTIRIYRPGKAVTMPPVNFFQDVTFAEGETGTQHIMKEISGVINAPVDMTIPTNQYFGWICYRASSSNDPTCSRHNGSNDAKLGISHTWYDFGYAVSLDTDVFKEIDETITFSLVSQADPSKRQDYTIRIYRPGKPVTMPTANFFQDVTFAEGETGMQHIMKEISGVINAPVDMTIPTNQYFGYICYRGSSSDAPTCPRHNGSNDAKLGISHTWYDFGYAVSLDTDVFKEIDETITFSLVSQADSSKRQDYTIRIYRPGKPVTMPSETLFQNVVFPAGTTGDQDVIKDITGQINANFDFNMPVQGFNVGTIGSSSSSGTMTWYGSARNNALSRGMNGPSTKRIGYRVTLPTDKYVAFNETLEFTFVSQVDATKKVTYVVNISRPSAEITMPPQTLFQDIVFPAGTTGQQDVIKNIEGQINTRFDFDMPVQGFEVGAFGSSLSSGTMSWYGSAMNGPITRELDGPTMKRIGYRVTLPSDEFVDFNETLEFTFESKSDATKKVTYVVNISRPGTEITMPPQNLFQDIVFPAGTTGETDVIKDITGQINTRFDFNMPAQGFYGGAIGSSASSGTMGWYGYAKDAPITRELDGPTMKRIGYRVTLPSDEFVDFNETLEFTFESKSDATKKVTYVVNISRPGTEITMPPQTLFEDIVFPAGTTGTKEVVKTITGQINTWFDFDMPVQGFDVGAIGDTDSSGTMGYYGSAMNGAISRGLNGDTMKRIGYLVALPSDQSVTFNETLEFGFISQIDPTRKVSYIVNISRPAL